MHRITCTAEYLAVRLIIPVILTVTLSCTALATNDSGTLCSFILSARGSQKRVATRRPVGHHTLMRATVTTPIKEVSVHVDCFEEGAAVDH